MSLMNTVRHQFVDAHVQVGYRLHRWISVATLLLISSGARWIWLTMRQLQKGLHDRQQPLWFHAQRSQYA